MNDEFNRALFLMTGGVVWILLVLYLMERV
jgi:hypothetical protein